jgi:hypothetical protein
MATGKVIPISADLLHRLPLACAWKGCLATCDNTRALPRGWIALATFRDTATPGVLDFRRDRVDRDAVLCPAHIEALERMLKPIR